MKIITLLTDFGTHDPYVGIMKGIVAGMAPGATVIDIIHDVEPQDIREAAFLVEAYWSYFPAGTVHVAVVDPGVGSARRPIVVSAGGHLFVGPDNGIFSLVMEKPAMVWAIENPACMREEVSATFHGRDIFAPAAARLAQDIKPPTIGNAVNDPVFLDNLFPVREGDLLRGEIVRLDRFGNAITNIAAARLQDFLRGRSFKIDIGDRHFETLSKSYFEAEYTCLVGSSGYIEFGRLNGSFAVETGLGKGQRVSVTTEGQ